MESEPLKNQVEKFRRSSGFTSGDPGSFTVPILKGLIELPGKYDPAAYFNKLELTTISNVAIVFPGNGGLCAEAIHRGATNVWAIEPRNQFNRALVALNFFMLDAGKSGFSMISSLDSVGSDLFDLIVWPEGLEQVSDPAAALKSVFAMLSPGGRLFIEVVHGLQEIPQGKTNSWRPKEEAFVKLLSTLFGEITARSMKGRLDKRTIYELTRPLPKQKQETKPVTEPKAQTVEFPEQLLKEFSKDTPVSLKDLAGIPTDLVAQAAVEPVKLLELKVEVVATEAATLVQPSSDPHSAEAQVTSAGQCEENQKMPHIEVKLETQEIKVVKTPKRKKQSLKKTEDKENPNVENA
jgi:Methyltransferase domain